jgi:hypothetical protein
MRVQRGIKAPFPLMAERQNSKGREGISASFRTHFSQKVSIHSPFIELSFSKA